MRYVNMRYENMNMFDDGGGNLERDFSSARAF